MACVMGRDAPCTIPGKCRLAWEKLSLHPTKAASDQHYDWNVYLQAAGDISGWGLLQSRTYLIAPDIHARMIQCWIREAVQTISWGCYPPSPVSEARSDYLQYSCGVFRQSSSQEVESLSRVG